MMVIFVDASVLVAAAISKNGGSRRAIKEAALHNFYLITTRYAYEEAEVTLRDGYYEHLDDLTQLASFINFVHEPSGDLIKACIEVIDTKDAPILAGAIAETADILITLDRKDFIYNAKARERYPEMEFLTPGDLIKKYFNQ